MNVGTVTEADPDPGALLDYELPPERIARHPVEPRDASRLLVLDRRTDRLVHARFRDLPAWLRAGDLLVLNDTRVVPARLRGRRSGGGTVEILLVRREETSDDGEVWRCLARPGKRLRAGDTASFPGGITAEWLAPSAGSDQRRVRLRADRPVAEILEEVGEVPLPPYLDRPAERDDRTRYQTVYARCAGSVAAPTAGLHFTPGLLERLRDAGVGIETVTLHVGPGTFLPIRPDARDGHRMLPEAVTLTPRLAGAVNQAGREGRRIVAVGTTTVRALEGAPGPQELEPYRGEVSLFIRPGHAFRRVDALVTNFHLPRSTLLELVAAFAGANRVLAAYREAVERGYRFYSYGDAMLLV